jgi:hypothetical protein
VFRPRCRGRKRRRGSRARGQRKAAPRAAPPCNRQRPFFVAGENEAQAAARALGLEVVRFEIRRASDIASSFESLKDRADALYVVGDPLFNANRIRINTFTLSARLPTVYPFRELVEAGGLMSYGPNIPDLFRRAAGYVDKILRGRSRVAKAASISPMVVALRIWICSPMVAAASCTIRIWDSVDEALAGLRSTATRRCRGHLQRTDTI